MICEIKFDVIGWATKDNTRHIGFVNDESTVEEGGLVRGAPNRAFGSKAWKDLVSCSDYQRRRRFYNLRSDAVNLPIGPRAKLRKRP